MLKIILIFVLAVAFYFILDTDLAVFSLAIFILISWMLVYPFHKRMMEKIYEAKNAKKREEE